MVSLNEIKLLAYHVAEILNGKPQVSQNHATISRAKGIQATINGRTTLASLHSAITFESLDKEGKALNLGEFVLLQEEIKPFMEVLVKHNITISALHNHWLYDKPNLYYLHCQAIDQPVTFARHIKLAFEEINSPQPIAISQTRHKPIIKIK